MDYFYDQADGLIKKAMTQPFQIPKRYQSQNTSTNHNEVSQSVMELLQGRERHLNMSGFLRLSNREKQCINLASEGLTCEEIGKIIFLSKRTVELYLQNAKNKTRCRNIVELSCKYSKFRDLMVI